MYILSCLTYLKTCKENSKIFTYTKSHVKKTVKSLHVIQKAKIGIGETE